jgi:predicted DNA-binding protein
MYDPAMTREKEEMFQTAVRFPRAWADRLEVLGKKLSPVVPLPMAAVLRAALERGITALEAEAGVKAAKASAPEQSGQKGAQLPARKPATK